VPETQEHVPADTIARVLASIPVNDGESDALLEADTTATGVDTRARFRLGPLTGVHPKAAAEFIGATNRAQRRRDAAADDQGAHRVLHLVRHVGPQPREVELSPAVHRGDQGGERAGQLVSHVAVSQDPAPSVAAAAESLV
jgi:hypothetical protein